ncbi:MAG TPA: DUF6789 family protein [Candidatus Nitrosotenuis sp.]|jgi:hypothetical protein|nr:DUF6789 family protein [Candidatus Nitrosotenuis sp.]
MAIERRPDWLARAFLSGFGATALMLGTFMLAFTLARIIGSYSSQPGIVGMLSTWFARLTENPVMEMARANFYESLALHMVVGVLFALVYAFWFQPRLPGEGWMKGMLFSLIPWFLSVVVFLPLVGAGLFGVKLQAGPLPAIGNLILHLIYGLTLGFMYGRVGDVPLETPQDEQERADEARAASSVSLGGARGVLIGLMLGLVAGFLLMQVMHRPVGPGEVSSPLTPGWFVVTAAILGAGLGGIIGSLAALPTTHASTGAGQSSPTR